MVIKNITQICKIKFTAQENLKFLKIKCFANHPRTGLASNDIVDN